MLLSFVCWQTAHSGYPNALVICQDQFSNLPLPSEIAQHWPDVNAKAGHRHCCSEAKPKVIIRLNREVWEIFLLIFCQNKYHLIWSFCCDERKAQFWVLMFWLWHILITKIIESRKYDIKWQTCKAQVSLTSSIFIAWIIWLYNIFLQCVFLKLR